MGVWTSVLLLIGLIFLGISIILSSFSASEARKKNANKAYGYSVASTVMGTLSIVLIGVAATILAMDYAGVLDQLKVDVKAKNALNEFVNKQIQASTCTQPVLIKDMIDMQKGVIQAQCPPKKE
jgi:Na+/proline symporter